MQQAGAGIGVESVEGRPLGRAAVAGCRPIPSLIALHHAPDAHRMALLRRACRRGAWNGARGMACRESAYPCGLQAIGNKRNQRPRLSGERPPARPKFGIARRQVGRRRLRARLDPPVAAADFAPRRDRHLRHALAVSCHWETGSRCGPIRSQACRPRPVAAGDAEHVAALARRLQTDPPRPD